MSFASFRPSTTAIVAGVLMGLLQWPLMTQADPLGDLIEQQTNKTARPPQSGAPTGALAVPTPPANTSIGKQSTGADASLAPAAPTAPSAWSPAAAIGAAAGVLGNPDLGASALSALNLPSLFGSSAGNVAGVLQYCVQNNYLKQAKDRANALQQGLLSVAGLQGSPTAPTSNSNYANGMAGILQGGEGERFDFGQIQAGLKEKACDYVLQQAPSLL